MGLAAYRSVLAVRDVRRVLALSFVVRVPMWAGNVILTLHVVTHLHRSYGAAGVVTAAATLALAVSGPWRGRRLDRVGLRRTVAPSLLVLAGCWSVAPFLGYWPLLGLACLAGLFVVPSFSIVRQAMINAVPDEQRKTALAVDSVMVEISFMAGPALGVVLATYGSSAWALFGCELASVLGGVLIWIINPKLRRTAPESPAVGGVRRRFDWAGPEVLLVLAMVLAATIVLTGTDVAVVAALRDMHHQPWIAWELTLWGLGSAIGGFAYGAMHRSVPVAYLLALLAATTAPIGLAGDPFTLAGLLIVSGFFCAPTITASVDALTRLVPERVRGEALGWHAAALTTGSAVGAPVAGVAVDRLGWAGGFLVPGLLGLAIAAAGLLVHRHTPAVEVPVPVTTS